MSDNKTMQGRGYVYVASSWRNPLHTAVCAALRSAGIGYYDFKNSPTEFRWSDVEINSKESSLATYLSQINHPIANRGFSGDFRAMQEADTFVLVLPCGRSAHLELGWAVGQGKRTAILMEDPCVPELMYKMVDYLAPSLFDLLGWLGVVD